MTLDSSASWKPVAIKQEIKQEETESSGTCSGAPPPAKRIKSVDSGVASPMSIGNPATPGSYKPPTPVQPCTPNSLQGPKTPQQCHSGVSSSTHMDPKFIVPSPVAMSQPQLVRQQSLPVNGSNNRPENNCHLAPTGKFAVNPTVFLSNASLCYRV